MRHARTLTTLAVLTLILAPGRTEAQVRSVADVETAGGSRVERPPTRRVFPFGDRALVWFQPEIDGDRLWLTDGTEEGTHPLVDVCPGGSRLAPHPGEPDEPLWIGDELVYFGVDCGAEGGGATWRTDGTLAGTFPILGYEVLPGEVLGLVPGTDLLLLQHQGLTVTDGTVGGTRSLATASSAVDGPRFASAPLAGGRVFSGGTLNDREPWITDGSVGGTRRLADLVPGAEGSNPRFFVSFAGQVFFVGRHQNGWWLGATDGTGGGTRWLAPVGESADERTFPIFARAITSGLYLGFVVVDGRPARGQLRIWRSDGTALGTRFVAGDAGFWAEHGVVAEVAQDRLLVTSRFPKQTSVVSDGEIPTAQHFPIGVVSPYRPVAFGDQLLYGGWAIGTGLWSLGPAGEPQELFRFCGDTDSPCARVTVLEPVSPQRPLVLESPEPVDGAGPFPTRPPRLWRTQGTVPGTELLHGFEFPASAEGAALPDGTAILSVGNQETAVLTAHDPGVGAPTTLVDWSPLLARRDSSPAAPTVLANGDLIFSARTAELGSRLYRRRAGPGALVTLDFDGTVAAPLAGGRFAFWRRVNSVDSLWAGDGTVAGSVEVFRFPRSRDSWPRVTTLGAALYFVAERQLLRLPFDGNQALPVATLPLDVPANYDFVAVGPRRLFPVHNDAGGFTLFVTDGTASGTAPLGEGLPTSAVAFRDRAFLASSQGTWLTDGTAAGTTRIDAGPTELFFVESLQAAGNRVFLVALGAAPGVFLWSHAGTPGSLQQLHPVTGVFRSATLPGGGLVFASTTPETGEELWFSDGTVAGTFLLGDLWPGPAGSRPTFLGSFGSRVFFQASDGVHGTELWATDGSPGGTVRLTDLAPGTSSSDPSNPALWNGEVVFAATDHGPRGRELWGVAVAAAGQPLPGTGSWLRSSALPGYRFQVRIAGPSGPIAGRLEPVCLAETLCISGAVAGRAEVFLRVVGPKPNGFLWPTLVKFTTSEVEVWIEQLATGALQHYTLAGAAPGRDELTGLFDREGFRP